MTADAGDAAIAVVHARARQPFEFALTLAFLERFPATSGEQRTDGGVLRCALREAGVVAGARVAAEGDGLRYELVAAAPALEARAVAAISRRLSFFLGVDDDVAAFYALADDDVPLRPVIQRLHGYHQVKFPSPLELLVWSILAQRAPLTVSRRLKRALVEHFGNRVALDGHDLWAFPDIEQLLTLTPDDLVALIANRRKAAYLHGALRGWAELEESFLRHGDLDAVRDRLLALPGIGPWSANFLLIRGLGRMERIEPDTEAKRAAARVYGHPVGDAEFIALAQRYGKLRGYWGHYLRVAG